MFTKNFWAADIRRCVAVILFGVKAVSLMKAIFFYLCYVFVNLKKKKKKQEVWFMPVKTTSGERISLEAEVLNSSFLGVGHDGQRDSHAAHCTLSVCFAYMFDLFGACQEKHWLYRNTSTAKLWCQRYVGPKKVEGNALGR